MSFALAKPAVRRFQAEQHANVSMIFALAAPVLLLSVAIAIDFTNATVVRSKLNAAADAAALAALTPAMLAQPDAVAGAAAVSMFNARASGINSISPGQALATPIITHPNGNQRVRNITVSYTAQSNTIFSGVLNLSAMNITGTSTAQASVPPNINFYLLLDNSPSMALPATNDGIALMQKLTPTQDNGNACAFACHQTSTNNGDTQGNPCTDGTRPTLSGTVNGNTVANQYCPANGSNTDTQIDNYGLSRANNITLRLDELSSGVSQLMQTAWNYQTGGVYSTPPNYQFTAYEMNSATSAPTSSNPHNTKIMGMTGQYVSGWNSASSSFGVMEMYSNNYGCANTACDSGVWTNDAETNFDVAMSDINNIMPNPGSGSNAPNDSPQEILFVVTDGVEDEQTSTRLIQPINGGTSTNYCSQIKARGVKIAILYTEYLAVPANSFYQQRVAPIQSQIGPALQACASPGLFYDAAIGSDLGAALSSLFQSAVQSASLSN